MPISLFLNTPFYRCAQFQKCPRSQVNARQNANLLSRGSDPSQSSF